MVALLTRRLADKDQVIRSKDETVALLTRQLADKDTQLPALLQAAVCHVQAEVTALRATLAGKDKTVGDMQAERSALRATLIERDAVLSEKKAQVAALTATVAERDRTVEVVGRANSMVSADNFHMGGRVTFCGSLRGTLRSIAGNKVTVQWDNGQRSESRIPDSSLTYL
jgi:chromosome segregation ATPase